MQRPSERSFRISMDAQREADAAHTNCFLDSGPPVIPQRQLQPRGGRAGCRRRDRRQPCPQTPNPAVTDAQPCPAPQAGLAAAVDGAFRPLRFPFFALVLTWARSVGCACADVGMGQDKVAKEGQSGKTAFSQGGVNGPNKLEGLVAFGSLKPGEAPRSRSSARRHAPHPPAALGCLDAAKSSLGGLWLSACGVDSRLAETPLRQRRLGRSGRRLRCAQEQPLGWPSATAGYRHSLCTNQCADLLTSRVTVVCWPWPDPDTQATARLGDGVCAAWSDAQDRRRGRRNLSVSFHGPAWSDAGAY